MGLNWVPCRLTEQTVLGFLGTEPTVYAVLMIEVAALSLYDVTKMLGSDSSTQLGQIVSIDYRQILQFIDTESLKLAAEFGLIAEKIGFEPSI